MLRHTTVSFGGRYITVRFGGAAVMALNAASFLALAVALLTLRRSLRPARSSGVPRPVRERVFLRDALKGLQHIWENRLLFWATVIRLAGLRLTLGSVDQPALPGRHRAQRHLAHLFWPCSSVWCVAAMRCNLQLW